MTLTIGAIITAAIFAIVGLLSVVAAIANWDWFFNSLNAQLYTGRMSRRAARIIYFILGVLILIMAIYLFFTLKQ
jgi:hypothetical protein